MRRFSRKRRAGSSGASRPIDAEHWLGQLREAGAVPSIDLTPVVHEDVPPDYALIARGETEGGDPMVVSFSPTDGGNALLGALATGARLAEEESFSGEILVIAPSWSIGARRRLGLIRAELPYRLRARTAEALSDEASTVEPEADLEPAALSVEALAAQVTVVEDRALFLRAARGLEGLAAKHGGATRAFGKQAELVVSARRMAELRLDQRKLMLTTWGQQKATRRLDAGVLADALDELEGQVRRRLNDRKVREGEDGLRARAIPLVVQGAGLRDAVAWPLGGSDEEELDVVGLRSDGRPAAAAIRSNFDLPVLGRFLDGLQRLRLAQASIFAGADAPVILDPPELLIVASEYSSGALRALSGLALRHEIFRAEEDRDKGLFLTPVGVAEAARSLREVREARGGRSRRGGRRRPASSADRAEQKAEPVLEEGVAADPASEDAGDSRPSERGRNRRRSRKRGRGRPSEEEGVAPAIAETSPSFDEVSLFELGEPEEAEDESHGRRRPRSRRKGRGSDGGDRSMRRGMDPKPEGSRETAASGASDSSDEDSDEFSEETFENLAELPTALEQDEGTTSPAYEDEEGEEEPRESQEAPSSEDLTPPEQVAAPTQAPILAEPPPRPRRRAVIVAAADRDSVGAAVLLARDIRLLEGIWIYPQSELMHFFREVTTDVQDDVPIHLVGFTPSPAVDVLQAASLYRDRISWYDHHEWPPEDAFALEQVIGAEAIHYTPGTGSTLPSILETSTRRSRFSDKLVDLVTGRFTQHDYERWGRLWWWRLGEISSKSGDVRREIDALLAGRPSDLAREASRAEAPPIPAEVAWVSERDFRLVHFAGYVMVVVETDPQIDIHLAGRIARERYGAQLSLSSRKHENLFLLTGDDATGRRSLDFAKLVQHLAQKLEWVHAPGAQDHVARIVIEGLEADPDRLQGVIREIAMGRSMLEG